MKRCVSELGLPGIRRMTRGLRVGNRLVGAWRGVFEELATQSGHRRYQPAHVDRYTATLALLQASMVAVSSLETSPSSGNPAVKRIRLFRPGIGERFLAKLRIEISSE